LIGLIYITWYRNILYLFMFFAVYVVLNMMS